MNGSVDAFTQVQLVLCWPAIESDSESLETMRSLTCEDLNFAYAPF